MREKICYFLFNDKTINEKLPAYNNVDCRLSSFQVQLLVGDYHIMFEYNWCTSITCKPVQYIYACRPCVLSGFVANHCYLCYHQHASGCANTKLLTYGVSKFDLVHIKSSCTSMSSNIRVTSFMRQG